MAYEQYFPAAWSEARQRFGVCAMTSTSIDEIRSNEVVLVLHPLEHRTVHEFFTEHRYAVWTYLIGTNEHTPIHNQPDDILLIFPTAAEADRFKVEWAFA